MKKYAKIVDENLKTVIYGEGANSEYYESMGMAEMDIEQGYDGKWYVEGYAPKKPAPTEEEQRKNREVAYTQEVDPITCHIQRLADEEQTPEVIEEIEQLKQERSNKVEEIKERYPYLVEEE